MSVSRVPPKCPERALEMLPGLEQGSYIQQGILDVPPQPLRVLQRSKQGAREAWEVRGRRLGGPREEVWEVRERRLGGPREEAGTYTPALMEEARPGTLESE